MFIPFRLKKPIGESYTVDLEDSINTKRALSQLGKLAVPDDGLDAYPTRPMFDAIKSFQRDQGLAIDGVMKPGGPTHRRLNEILEGREKPFPVPPTDGVVHPLSTATQAAPVTHLQPVSLTRPLRPSTSVDLGDVDRVKSALHVLGLPPSRGGDDPYPSTDLFNNIRTFQRREGLAEDGEMLPGGETEMRLNEVLLANSNASERLPGNETSPEVLGQDGNTNAQLAQATLPIPAGHPLIVLGGLLAYHAWQKYKEGQQKEDGPLSQPGPSERDLPETDFPSPNGADDPTPRRDITEPLPTPAGTGTSGRRTARSNGEPVRNR